MCLVGAYQATQCHTAECHNVKIILICYVIFQINWFSGQWTVLQCLLQSYILASDMHFYIVAIPVVVLLSKRPRVGVVVLVGVLLVSILIPFLVTYLEHKPALVTFYIEYVPCNSIHCRTLFWFHRAFLKINTVLHQPNALIYLKNTKIFYKILDKNPTYVSAYR
jgi:hypothetical protein